MQAAPAGGAAPAACGGSPGIFAAKAKAQEAGEGQGQGRDQGRICSQNQILPMDSRVAISTEEAATRFATP